MGAVPDPYDVYEAHLVTLMRGPTTHRKDPTMGEMTDDHDAYSIRDLDGAYSDDYLDGRPAVMLGRPNWADRLVAPSPRQQNVRRTADLIEAYEERLVTLHRTRKFLELMPADDPNVDGDVLLIRRRFPDSDIQYVYACVRGGDLYHLTGSSPRTPQRVDWTELVQWLAGDPDCEIRKVTAVSAPFQWGMTIPTTPTD